MPIYAYACGECGHEFELRQSFSAEPQQPCPQCSATAKRQIQAVGVIYKGSGFYTTDYARKTNSPPASSSKSEEKSSSSSSASSASSSSGSTSESKPAPSSPSTFSSSSSSSAKAD
ncbi:MAG: FmdB family zinc ribbon protein [Chloroflexota bacterium]